MSLLFKRRIPFTADWDRVVGPVLRWTKARPDVGKVAFGMECYEKGLVTREQLEGHELRWGSVDDFEHFVDMMVHRRGIGDRFARGIVHAAGKIGHDSIRFTAQVKGQGMSGYDGRGAPAMLLSYMTADIGAHHNRAWTITMDEDLGKSVIRGKAKVVVYLQHIRPFFDVVSCCRLLWGEVDVIPEEHIESIGLPPGHVAMAFVDSTIVHLSYVPKDGEVITLRPPVQGG